MKVGMIGLVLMLMLGLLLPSVCVAEEQGYFAQMGQSLARGSKNFVSFPWEIPSTIARYDQKTDGNPRFFRDVAGFVDGTFRSVTRFGCGVWDIFFSIVPGQQNELPLKPETFF
ncbi:MAG: hypothetical protein V1882_03685 [Candidatus Omnitrophota bacterium]